MKTAALGLGTAIALTLNAFALPPMVIDENRIMGGFEDKLGKLHDDGQTKPGDDLVKQLPSVIGKEVKIPSVRSKGNDYAKLCPSVGVVGTIFKCDKCTRWHRPGMATAWVASEDGVVVTNYHVVMGTRGQAAVGITFPNGKVYPVTDVLSADPLQDIAVIKVKAPKGELQPLPLGPDAPVGSDISIISHPDSRFYMMTQGKVARYLYPQPIPGKPRVEEKPQAPKPDEAKPDAQPEPASTVAKSEPQAAQTPATPATPAAPADSAPKTAQSPVQRLPLLMNVTAEYAKGSSGGPVFDSRGRVVGMVSSTQSIYYGNRDPKKAASGDPGPFQMVVRNCVPVYAISQLLKVEK